MTMIDVGDDDDDDGDAYTGGARRRLSDSSPRKGGVGLYLYFDGIVSFAPKRAGHPPSPLYRPRQRRIKRCQVGRDVCMSEAFCRFFFFLPLWPLGRGFPPPARPLCPPPHPSPSSISVAITRQVEGVPGRSGVCVCVCVRCHPCAAVKLARFLSRAGPCEWSGLHRSHVVHGSFTTVFCTRHPHHAMNCCSTRTSCGGQTRDHPLATRGGGERGGFFPNSMPSAIGPRLADRFSRGACPRRALHPLLPRGTSMHTRASVAGHVIATWAGRATLEPNERAKRATGKGRGGAGGETPVRSSVVVFSTSCIPPSSASATLAWSMGEDLPVCSLGPLSRALFRVGPHGDKCSG